MLTIIAKLRAQVLLEALAEKLNKKTSNIRPIFRSFDENKDGTVSYAEFRHGLTMMGAHPTKTHCHS